MCGSIADGRPRRVARKRRRLGLGGWFVAGVLAATALQAWATNEGGERIVCPACKQPFEFIFIGSTSFGGSDQELRPRTLGEDIQRMRINACPRCHYAGLGGMFQGRDVPRGETMEAVRAALAREGRSLPAGPLWPLEKVAAAEICLRACKGGPEELLDLYMLGAWLADDAGEDALASGYRDKALRACARLTAAGRPPAGGGGWQAWYLHGLLLKRQGRLEQAATALRQGRDFLGTQCDRLQKEHEDLRERARQAAASRPAAQTAPAGGALGDADEQEAKAQEAEMERQEMVFHVAGLCERACEVLAEVEMTRGGEDKAREMAAKGGFSERKVFARMFRASRDARTVATIQHILDQPLGTEVARLTPDKREHLQAEYRERLKWYLEPPPWVETPEPEQPADEQAEVRQDLESIRMARLREGLIKREASPALTRPFRDDQAYPPGRKVSGAARFNSRDYVRMLAERETPQAGAALLDDLLRHTNLYLHGRQRDDADEPVVWQTMALAPEAALRAARTLLDRLARKELTAREAALGLRPLACVKTPAAAELLSEAAGHPEPAVAARAVLALAKLGQRRAAAVFVARLEALADEMPTLRSGSARALVKLIVREDYDQLVRAAGRLGEPGAMDPWRIALPRVVSAAIARADPARGRAQFEAMLAKASSQRGEYQMSDEEILFQLAHLHCTDSMDRRVGQVLRTQLGDLTEALELAGAWAMSHHAEALAALVRRPVPLEIKMGLLEHVAGRFDVGGLEEAARRWAASRNKALAASARAALERMGKRPPGKGEAEREGPR
ncbi:MAG TPA: hypothetical protein PLD58_03150 [Phycisphaerae bacterium]|nr:hypothetical protein [Phycisphaerae bacterium]